MSTIIVAYDTNRAIGRDGDIPWMGQLPIDMRHFRDTTRGHTVIMGRKTFESLPEASRPLPGRHNIVLTLSRRAIAGVSLAHSINEALDIAGKDGFVIGGGTVYEQALPYVDRVIATEIDTEIPDTDTFFPELAASEWSETKRTLFHQDDRNAFSGAFVEYIRSRKI